MKGFRLAQRGLLGLVFTMFFVVLASLGMSASSPRVVATIPAAGDGYVDFELTEISLTFDQPMSTTSYSYVSLGNNFPEVTGNPRWTDANTCVLPVSLRPNTDYWLYVNSQDNYGFQNREGEPATPFLLAFRTVSEGQNKRPSEEQQDRNLQSFAQLEEIMTTHYSYKDRLSLAWGSIIAAEKDALLHASDDFIFAARTLNLLAAAQDPHLLLQIGQQTVPAFLPIAKTNYNLQAGLQYMENLTQWSNCVVSGDVGDIGYIVIAGWVNEAAKAVDAIQEFRDRRAIIIDVRPNSGGNELIAQAVAGCFTDQAVPYAKSLVFDPETNEFTSLNVRELQPNRECAAYQGAVFVLTGEKVMSSNEAFLLMMKTVGVTLIGETSYGSSGNPNPYTLANGLTLHVPQWQAMDMDGNLIEGKGIEPDIFLDFLPEEFVSDDPLLRKSLEMVEQWTK